jgi:hypothetical protein
VISADAEDLGEMVHHLGQMIEGVREFVRPSSPSTVKVR